MFSKGHHDAAFSCPPRVCAVQRSLTLQRTTACDTSEIPEYVARNRAILAVLLDTGLRANELCSLDVTDAHLTDDDAYLTVRMGKGRRQREVPLGKRSRLLVIKYLHRHRPKGGTALFLAKGGSPLTVSGLEQLIGKLIHTAGEEHFLGLKQGAHLFRYTFAVRALEAGLDIYRLSRIMGHSTVSTTEGYLKSFTARQA